MSRPALRAAPLTKRYGQLTSTDWTATSVMPATATALTVAGMAGYRRRDLLS